LKSRFAQTRAAPESVEFIDALRTEPFVADLLKGTLALEWAQATLVADDPAKTLANEVDRDLLLLPSLLRTAGAPTREFDLVSPYLVLGEQGTAAVVATAQRGVKVRILTNSLASTDVGAVHAGYAKRRHDLLAAGVTLYEIKPDVDAGAAPGKHHVGSSSSASLHAKTFALDRERLFVGSFNFDPRSALLNTEMGLVIANPMLARELATAFDRDVPKAAYEVRLQPDGRSLVWIERTAQDELRHDTEPGTSAWRRLGVSIMSVLPIDWLL
jgi:putative cardiolipin synthase